MLHAFFLPAPQEWFRKRSQNHDDVVLCCVTSAILAGSVFISTAEKWWIIYVYCYTFANSCWDEENTKFPSKRRYILSERGRIISCAKHTFLIIQFNPLLWQICVSFWITFLSLTRSLSYRFVDKSVWGIGNCVKHRKKNLTGEVLAMRSSELNMIGKFTCHKWRKETPSTQEA